MTSSGGGVEHHRRYPLPLPQQEGKGRIDGVWVSAIVYSDYRLRTSPCDLADAPSAVVAQVIAGGPQLLFDQFVGQCLVDAATRGRLEVLRLLLARPSGWVPSVEVAECALEFALGGEHAPCVIELLRACPQITANLVEDFCVHLPSDDTPGALEIAREVLKDPRVDVDVMIVEYVEDCYENYYDEDDNRGDFIGGRRGYLELVLTAGAVPSPAAADRALLFAAANCDKDCLRLLLTHCPQITAPARTAALTAAIRSDAKGDKLNALLCLLQIGGAEPPVEVLVEAAERDDGAALKLFAPFVAKALRAGQGAGGGGAGGAGAGGAGAGGGGAGGRP